MKADEVVNAVPDGYLRCDKEKFLQRLVTKNVGHLFISKQVGVSSP